MKSLAVRVPRRNAEAVRRELVKADRLRQDLRITAQGSHVLLPVKGDVPGHRVTKGEFEAVGHRPRSYRHFVQLPEDLQGLLPRAYEVIGDVAVIRLPWELEDHGAAIGAALLTHHEGVRTVAVDQGVQGRLRRRVLHVVAGRETTRTIHREYGLAFSVDPAQVYFSPRMAGERHRVAAQVAPGETIVDAFCGVGPFAVHVARAGARVVYAVDSNPEALEHLRRNVTLNRLENVVALEGDVSELVPPLEAADRVILDYPQDPRPYFPMAVEAVRNGGLLHYYEILGRVDRGGVEESLRNALPPGFTLTIRETRLVRGYSPTQAHYGFDLEISRA